MSIWRILVTVLLLIHPALSKRITTTCEIPSVEEGDNTTLTIHFGQDLRQEGVRDFSVEHIGHSSTASQTRLVDCEFSYGNVTCKKTSCCTWESHVTDIFRVYIYNVSQELEGRFWGFVIPASTEYQKSCNFSLKASTCRTDHIISTNSRVFCTNQPVTIGQTCTVTCNPDHYFQENHTSVTYTCVGKNKWSPEMMFIACKEQPKGQETSNSMIGISMAFLIVAGIGIVLVFIWYKWKRRQKWKKRTREVETNWLEFIRKWYPDLQSCTYFLPPLHFNRVLCCKQSVAGNLAPMLHTPQDSGVRDDRALKRVLLCLHALAHNSRQADNSQETDNLRETDKLLQANNPQETHKLQQADNSQQKEVMMIISQLSFGKYIGQPSYAGAVALLPLYSKLSGLSQRHYHEGECDVLVIHKTFGLLMLQITTFGENFSQLEMTEQEKDDVVKKVKEAVTHLNRAETDLKHLTSDIVDIKHITKILVLPNISSNQLLHAINRFPSDAEFLRECLGAESVDLAVKLCLLKDQLSDNQTPSDNNPSFLQALREWWQHVVMVSRSESLLRSSLYEQLVARFCGSATTVKVHCVTAPRLNITTLGKGVSETGERVDRIVLFPQQVDILNQSPPRAFLSGPPGTGKTIVLIMQGLTWLQRGYDIHVISTCDESRAATIVIEHQLQETAKTSTAKSRVYRHQFDLTEDGEVETAVSCLKSLYEGRQLCVIADDAVRDDRKPFSEFCDQLIKEVRGVFIWGASMYHDVIPECLKEFKLTTPLRSPPVVVREVMESLQIKKYKQVHDYTVNDVPVPTDGPPVMRIEHLDGQLGHTGDWPSDCVECGREVAHVLTELNVGRTGDSNGPPHLQYGDVLVLCDDYPTDDRVDSNGQVTTASGLVRGLHDCHVPVRVVEKDDVDAIRDMALGVGDLVTVAFWGDVRGLERKVVVVESGPEWFDRLHTMSRCTSQLVVIKYCPV